MRFTVCTALRVVFLLSVAWGRGEAGEQRVRTDVYGDPLPPGAIARLGTIRFQHDGSVQALAYSPDGKWLASGDICGVLRLWDGDTGKLCLRIKGHYEPIVHLAFVPAGEGKQTRVLVSASADKSIRLWDLKTGKQKSRINHPGAAGALAVSPDGRLLASGSEKGAAIHLWRVEDGKEVRRWRAHQGGVAALTFSSDGKTLFSGGMAHSDKKAEPADDYVIAMWETSTGKIARSLSGPVLVKHAALAAHGKLLVAAGQDRSDRLSVFLWDLKTGKSRTIDASPSDTARLDLTWDGRFLAVLEKDGIELLDTISGVRKRAIPTTATQHLECLTFSPDGRTLALAESGRISLWDVGRGRWKWEGQGHVSPVTGIAVAPNGQSIVTTSWGEWAWLWDRATGRPLHQLGGGKIWGFPKIGAAAYSPDGRTIALSRDRGIEFRDVSTGKIQKQFMDAEFGSVASLLYSPDGKWLISMGIEHTFASMWDTTIGSSLGSKDFDHTCTAIALSPDGKLRACAMTYRGLQVWRMDNDERLFRKPDDLGRSVAFSPGGILLVSAGDGVQVYDARTGAELVRHKADFHPLAWRGIAFSPDGRFLAFPDYDRVKIWDIFTRRFVCEFKGHSDWVTATAFTPDGKALVSASLDCTALIWDLTAVLPAARGTTRIQWKDLEDADRLKAYAAYCRLLSAPAEARSLIEEIRKPAAAVSAETLTELLRKLDSDSFAVREQAFRELKKHGLAAEIILRQAARNKPSPEASRRIARLIKALDTCPDWQRLRIALQTLVESPSPTARTILHELARGNSDSRLTIEAKAILQRIPPGPEPKSSPARPH